MTTTHKALLQRVGVSFIALVAVSSIGFGTAYGYGGGGGGGGIISGPYSVGFTNGGQVLGTSTSKSGTGSDIGGSGDTGQVLGASTSYNFTVNLHQGSRGADVSALQQILIADGYLNLASPTGYFGPLTFAAVKKYQAAHHIPATGFVGSLTRAALNAGE